MHHGLTASYSVCQYSTVLGNFRSIVTNLLHPASSPTLNCLFLRSFFTPTIRRTKYSTVLYFSSQQYVIQTKRRNGTDQGKNIKHRTQNNVASSYVFAARTGLGCLQFYQTPDSTRSLLNQCFPTRIPWPASATPLYCGTVTVQFWQRVQRHIDATAPSLLGGLSASLFGAAVATPVPVLSLPRRSLVGSSCERRPPCKVVLDAVLEYCPHNCYQILSKPCLPWLF